MNRGIADGDAAFIAHCGDILRESMGLSHEFLLCILFSCLVFLLQRVPPLRPINAAMSSPLRQGKTYSAMPPIF